jgi:hypothetical protein
MTITSALVTVADSISKLVVTGITIKDIDEIPDNAAMLCPILIPQPNGYISDISVEFQSFGSNTGAKIDMDYTLNYVYLHCQAGLGLGTFSIYSGLITKLAAIIVAILSNDAITGLVDMQLQNIGNIGVIDDPAGNQYWGVLLSFRVKEFSQ